MYDQKETSTIQCDIYQDCYAAMDEIKLNINQGSTVGIKAKYAEELLDRVACLTDCPQYSDQKQECKHCRMMANVHKRTAEIIIKAKQLSQ